MAAVGQRVISSAFFQCPVWYVPAFAGALTGKKIHRMCEQTIEFDTAYPIGIGAGLAARPLPHHRAYGSVHGGSDRLPDRANRWRSKRSEVTIGQRNVQRRATTKAPYTVPNPRSGRQGLGTLPA